MAEGLQLQQLEQLCAALCNAQVTRIHAQRSAAHAMSILARPLCIIGFDFQTNLCQEPCTKLLQLPTRAFFEPRPQTSFSWHMPQDPDTRRQAEAKLAPLGQSTEYIAMCKVSL